MPDFRLDPGHGPLDFNSVKVGGKRLRDDVVADVDKVMEVVSRDRPVKKEDVGRALKSNDVRSMRRMSEHFFKSNGIYAGLCRYMANLYKYDWVVTPMRLDDRLPDKKVFEGWVKSLTLLDGSSLKRVFGEVALKVIRNGSYYAYLLPQKGMVQLQELPADYCRSRYTLNGLAAVEFNVKYFDDCFKDADYRLRVLKLFPKEVQRAYVDYKKGALPKDYSGDDAGWALLDPEQTVKLNMNGSDVPFFFSVIPSLLDLADAQELDKRKMAQQLMRVIIQKLPLKKDGDLVFDMQEAAQMHTNASRMVGDAVGVDVLTTFADVDVADMSDKGNVSSVDQLDKVERSVYNGAGVSQMLFNATGNLALDKAIAVNEASIACLLQQFEELGQRMISPFNRNRSRLYYEFSILPTTVFNYKDLAKLYKEQATIGFSLLLPQVAMGRSQLSVLSTAVFENQILNVNELFVPPQMSSTMTSSGSGEVGRPEKDDGEKSEKTIQNIESAQ